MKGLQEMVDSDGATVNMVDDDGLDLMSQDIPDYHARMATLREHKGVARLPMGGGAVFALLRYADVAAAVRDATRYSKSEAFRPSTFPFMGPNIQGYDGHEHAVKRALVSPAFRRGTVPSYIKPLMRPIAEELTARIASKGNVDF